jgi:transposase
MDWSKMQGFFDKGKDIFEMAQQSLGKDAQQNEDVEKGLFDRKEKEEIEQLTAQLEEQKKKSETTLMYVVGAMVVLMFTGILKIK